MSARLRHIRLDHGSSDEEAGSSNKEAGSSDEEAGGSDREARDDEAHDGKEASFGIGS
ncbi:hypothetical protein H4S02_009658, partial [Coemansia sp. RSA 2611]